MSTLVSSQKSSNVFVKHSTFTYIRIRHEWSYKYTFLIAIQVQWEKKREIFSINFATISLVSILVSNVVDATCKISLGGKIGHPTKSHCFYSKLILVVIIHSRIYYPSNIPNFVNINLNAWTTYLIWRNYERNLISMTDNLIV